MQAACQLRGHASGVPAPRLRAHARSVPARPCKKRASIFGAASAAATSIAPGRAACQAVICTKKPAEAGCGLARFLLGGGLTARRRPVLGRPLPLLLAEDESEVLAKGQFFFHGNIP